MRSRKLLTFELAPDGDQLDIHLNREGLEDLIKYLQRLAESRQSYPRHDHLMTPSWAGQELSEEKQGPDAGLLNKVTIRLWE